MLILQINNMPVRFDLVTFSSKWKMTLFPYSIPNKLSSLVEYNDEPRGNHLYGCGDRDGGNSRNSGAVWREDGGRCCGDVSGNTISSGRVGNRGVRCSGKNGRSGGGGGGCRRRCGGDCDSGGTRHNGVGWGDAAEDRGGDNSGRYIFHCECGILMWEDFGRLIGLLSARKSEIKILRLRSLMT